MKRAALLCLAAIAILAFLLPVVAPLDGLSQNRALPLAPPGPGHWLGTDPFGRDQFARLILGLRLSLSAGLLATTLALGLGATLGALAGFRRGWPDALVMRTAELFQSLPWFFLLLALRALLPLSLRPSAALLSIALMAGLTGWPRPARIVRGIALAAREREYVQAARAFGASGWYLVRRHILPEAAGAIAVQAALLLPQFVMAEVILSFVGLGVGEPAPSLGLMLSALRDLHLLTSCPWMLAPAFLLILITLCCQTLANRWY
jgi:peptide/nickel transport system permease protein